ncbi:MAG: hypothetical protein AAB955_00875 [Patescibacteria group bacterium]
MSNELAPRGNEFTRFGLGLLFIVAAIGIAVYGAIPMLAYGAASMLGGAFLTGGASMLGGAVTLAIAGAIGKAGYNRTLAGR